MTTKTKFTIGLVQMAMTDSPDENLERAVHRLEDAARRGANLVCLPELFRSRYFCQREDTSAFDLAESIPGPSTARLAAVAKAAGISIIAPIFERRAAGVYHNSAVLIDPNGQISGTYRKMHIPDDPGYYEKYYFTPGDFGFRAFASPYGPIGVLICWDQWFPEAARLTALQGAGIIFYPTAIGWHPHEKDLYGSAQRDAWRTVQRGHAIANGVYVAAVNRVGHENTTADGAGIEFWGSSFVADPQGVVVAEASAEKEDLILADVDTARIEDVRRNWPFLRDRRVDAYGGIGQRFIDRTP